MKSRLCLVLAALGLSGCTASLPPGVLPLADPSDPAAATGRAAYRPVVTNYEHRSPVSPKPWRRQPAPAAGGTGS